MENVFAGVLQSCIDVIGEKGHPVESGLEYQCEFGWPALALAPINTHRDVGFADAINWETLIGELPDPMQYAIARERTFTHGWSECLYFNPQHEATARAVVSVFVRAREDGCADVAELSRREISELAACVDRSIVLPEGVPAHSIALALRTRDGWESNDSYRDAWALEEVREFAHVCDDYFNEGVCVCGLDEAAAVHHRDSAQVEGQMEIPNMTESGVFLGVFG